MFVRDLHTFYQPEPQALALTRSGSTLTVSDWDNRVDGDLIHEFGHQFGLAAGTQHAGYDPQHIMYGTSGSSRKELKKTDAEAFEEFEPVPFSD